MRFPSYLCLSVFICGQFLLFGCSKSNDHALVLYTSVDQPVAEPILKAFEAKTGIHVDARYDTEATKSVGLSERLRAEKDHPQCDVWWGNEIFLTINLATDGVLAEYDSPSAADVPARFKDTQNRWTASGMRVRVLAVQQIMPDDIHAAPLRRVTHLSDLTAPWLKDKIAFSRPVAGTATGHVAALYVAWGDTQADAFFKALHDNGCKLVGGNSIVAQGVANGQFLAGVTDNDDAADAIVNHGNLMAILPDQEPGGLGTLAIPCTVAEVAGAPHGDAARQLIDYLLSKETEQQMIAAGFVKYSVRAGEGEIRTMDVDYNKVAAILPEATRRATAILDGRND